MRFAIIYIICIISFNLESSAGAWLQESNHLQAIYTRDVTLDNKYSDGYQDLYLEYGLKDKTIGANFYIKNTDKNFRENYYKDDRIVNFFIRKKWFQNDKYIVSTEKIFYLKPAGYRQKLLVGRSFYNFYRSFTNLEFSIHKNYIDPLNLRAIFTAGFHINDSLMFISESINSYRHYRLKTYDVENKTYNKTVIHKSIISKIACSLIYKLDYRYSLQIGYSDRIHKKYIDKNFFTAIWLSL